MNGCVSGVSAFRVLYYFTVIFIILSALLIINDPEKCLHGLWMGFTLVTMSWGNFLSYFLFFLLILLSTFFRRSKSALKPIAFLMLSIYWFFMVLGAAMVM